MHATSGWNPVLLAAALGGIAVLTLGRHATDGTWRLALLGAWVSLPIAVGVAAAVLRPFLVPRYAIVIAPALALQSSKAS